MASRSVLLFGLFGVLLASCRAQTDVVSAPARLTAQNYDAVRAHVRPRPSDLNFQKIPWFDSLFEGVVQAQREDKPLVLSLYFGDARGAC
jgi:hypothetical protein